jgi:hypothetical protein
MHARAVADARLLPTAARPPFVAGFAHAARSGLQVGRGESVSSLPSGAPASLLAQLRHLIRDVFTHGYIAAIHPTLAISVAVLLAGAASCMLLRRDTPASASGTAAAAATAARGQAAAKITAASE